VRLTPRAFGDIAPGRKKRWFKFPIHARKFAQRNRNLKLNPKEAIMWDWLKDAAKRLANAGAEFLQHRTFILSLLNMAPPQAEWALRQKIEEMDDDAMTAFNSALAGLIGEAQAMAQQASYQGSFGTSFEDRTA
jgi:hypothetical protein